MTSLRMITGGNFGCGLGCSFFGAGLRFLVRPGGRIVGRHGVLWYRRRLAGAAQRQAEGKRHVAKHAHERVSPVYWTQRNCLPDLRVISGATLSTMSVLPLTRLLTSSSMSSITT